MPAAVRGAGRSTAKARSKSSSPVKSRGGPAKAPQRAAPHSGFSVSPRIIAGVVVLVLVGALGIAAFTDDRAERAVASLQTAALNQSAALGFRVDNVRLVGASSRSQADILKAAALPERVPLFGVDLEAARKRVEQVGWVKSARVMRLMPDSVMISVEERQLLAVWQHAGRTLVIDNEGVSAPEADPAKFANLPLVVGEGANTAAAGILPLVLTHSRLMSRLDALVRVDGRRWDLRLKDGCLIQLPPTGEDAALIKLDQLDQTSRILDLGLQRIDLRDPEMVLVRPRQSPTADRVSSEG